MNFDKCCRKFLIKFSIRLILYYLCGCYLHTFWFTVIQKIGEIEILYKDKLYLYMMLFHIEWFFFEIWWAYFFVIRTKTFKNYLKLML